MGDLVRRTLKRMVEVEEPPRGDQEWTVANPSSGPGPVTALNLVTVQADGPEDAFRIADEDYREAYDARPELFKFIPLEDVGAYRVESKEVADFVVVVAPGKLSQEEMDEKMSSMFRGYKGVERVEESTGQENTGRCGVGDLQRQILKRVVEAEDAREQRGDTRVVRGPHVTKIEVGRRGSSGSIIYQPEEWEAFKRAVQREESFRFQDETGMIVKARVEGDQVILDTGGHMGEVQVPVSEVLGVESPETEGCPEKKEGSELQIYSTEPSGAMGEQEPEPMVEPSGEMGEEDPAEKVAKAFHETYERLAPEHGYDTRDESAKPWEEVPEENKSLMIATVKDLLDQGVITAETPEETPVETPPEEYVEVTPEVGEMKEQFGEIGVDFDVLARAVVDLLRQEYPRLEVSSEEGEGPGERVIRVLGQDPEEPSAGVAIDIGPAPY